MARIFYLGSMDKSLAKHRGRSALAAQFVISGSDEINNIVDGPDLLSPGIVSDPSEYEGIRWDPCGKNILSHGLFDLLRDGFESIHIAPCGNDPQIWVTHFVEFFYFIKCELTLYNNTVYFVQKVHIIYIRKVTIYICVNNDFGLYCFFAKWLHEKEIVKNQYNVRIVGFHVFAECQVPVFILGSESRWPAIYLINLGGDDIPCGVPNRVCIL